MSYTQPQEQEDKFRDRLQAKPFAALGSQWAKVDLSEVEEASKKRRELTELETAIANIEHGTTKGYSDHMKYGTPTCDICKLAHTEANTERNRERRAFIAEAKSWSTLQEIPLGREGVLRLQTKDLDWKNLPIPAAKALLALREFLEGMLHDMGA